MDPSAPESLFEALRESGLYTPEQLAAIPEVAAAAGGDLAVLSETLFSRGLLTGYQTRKVRVNRIAELVIGRYLVLDKIGEGGMGKVFKAAERGTGRVVALKVVRAHLMANKTVVGRYRREAAAAATLNHPNIVALLDADEAFGRYYLAMEYVVGSDLSRMVKEYGPLPYQEATEYIRQAAVGLQHAHERGLVHRDIKPSNLLVSGERALPGTGGKATVKILDMGLVRLRDEDTERSELTRDGTVVGTPDYMSPEQAKNSSTVDHRADLYSLGCAFYLLLTGKPPFPDGTPIDKLLRHQLDPPPDLLAQVEDIPIGLAAVIHKLLAKKPYERPRSAGELAVALLPYTPGAAPPAAPADSPPARRKPDRPRKSIPDGTTAVTVAPTASGRVAVVARADDDSPPTIPRPTAPVVIVRPVENPNSSGNIAVADMVGGEPLDAEPVSAEPIKRVPPPVRRPRTRPRSARGTPDNGLLILLSVLGVAAAVGAAVGIYALVRSKDGPPPAPKSGAPAVPPGPVAADELPPAAVNLPDDAAACLVFHPREFRDRAKAAVKPDSPLGTALKGLADKYGFDPWGFDRLTVAAPAGRPLKYVAVGEFRSVPADWAEKMKEAGKATGAGSDRMVFFQAAGGTQVFGAAAGDRGIALGTDRPGVVSAARQSAARREARLSAEMLRELRDPRGAMLVAVADGKFILPVVGDLSKSGVDLATLRVWYRDDAFHAEVVLAGKDREELKAFFNERFAPRIVERYEWLRKFMGKVSEQGATFDTADGKERMKMSGHWGHHDVMAWADELLTGPGN